MYSCYNTIEIEKIVYVNVPVLTQNVNCMFVVLIRHQI